MDRFAGLQNTREGLLLKGGCLLTDPLWLCKKLDDIASTTNERYGIQAIAPGMRF